ncbi:YqaI family protein [Paraliobacillus sediminis]|uniref:YqaI family protein n=1 Tax=Paraliobacillus sediminis TaxID=1885916 RepID=UPI000E3DD85C|nr:hypothetical protein [Paraliobacillus sediminis]
MLLDLEHPSISKVNRRGYEDPVVDHIEHDAFGDEISPEDKVYETDSGDIVLASNLDMYLKNELDFEIRQ